MAGRGQSWFTSCAVLLSAVYVLGCNQRHDGIGLDATAHDDRAPGASGQGGREICNNGFDDNLDGHVDEHCGCPTQLATQTCWLPDPSGDGTQQCASTQTCEAAGPESLVWTECRVAPGCAATACEDGATGADCALPLCRTDEHGDGVCTGKMAVPIDIVLVIDGSESMYDEMGIVNANLVAFANVLAEASVDYRLIMLGGRIGEGQRQEIEQKGGGRIIFAGPGADSWNAFDRLEKGMLTYSGNTLEKDLTYAQHLREGATTHFVVVTDDESERNLLYTPKPVGISFTFIDDMKLLLGRPVRFHAVASEVAAEVNTQNCDVRIDGKPIPRDAYTAGGIQQPEFVGDYACHACRGRRSSAKAAGRIYYDTAKKTNGETFSVCADDWTPFFHRLLPDSIKRDATQACRCAPEQGPAQPSAAAPSRGTRDSAALKALETLIRSRK